MRPLQTYIGNPGEDRVAQIVERCEKAISRGLEWLAGRVSAEGELEGSETVLFGYYKALLTFTAAGRYLEAERAARKIKRAFYKDGQFGGEQYSAATVGPIYRHSWLTWGAHIAGPYDISVPAPRPIPRLLCRLTGGTLPAGSPRPIPLLLSFSSPPPLPPP